MNKRLFYLLCKVPIQIIGTNFVTSIHEWKTNVNNAKCNKKEFLPDVKGLNFDVFRNYLLKSLFLKKKFPWLNEEKTL